MKRQQQECRLLDSDIEMKEHGAIALDLDDGRGPIGSDHMLRCGVDPGCATFDLDRVALVCFLDFDAAPFYLATETSMAHNFFISFDRALSSLRFFIQN
jgi:hypothetical protein